MEKVKDVFSKVWAWIKSHAVICIAVVAVIVLAIVLVSFLGGAEKRAIKKYISAINSYDYQKVYKATNVDAAIAWKKVSYSSDDQVADFKDNLEDVDDDAKDSYKDSLKDAYDEDDKGQMKAKLLNVVYSTTAKDDKNLKKVVCKVRVTSKPDKDKDDEDDKDDKEDNIWKKEKEYTQTVDTYVTFILYKNKVISAGL